MYNIKITNRASKEILKLPDYIFNKIDSIILDLKENPRPNGCLKLTDSEGFRIRINDYRLLYKISEDTKEIIILRVTHRKDAYKKK